MQMGPLMVVLAVSFTPVAIIPDFAGVERLIRLAVLDPEKPWAKAAKARAESLMTTNREDAK